MPKIWVVMLEILCWQLRDWLDLSLNHSVPSSLLILSRYIKRYGSAFTLNSRFWTIGWLNLDTWTEPSLFLGRWSLRKLFKLHYLHYLMKLLIQWELHLCHQKTLFQKGEENWSTLRCRRNSLRQGFMIQCLSACDCFLDNLSLFYCWEEC